MAMKCSELTGWSTQPPAHDEMKLIYDYIILSLVLTVVERNRSKLETKGRSLRSIFVRTADLVIAKLEADITGTRRSLLLHNIVVNRNHEAANGMSYRYSCRGYEEQIILTQPYLRTEVNARISAYTADIFTKK